jgi:GAF domain-containing protein
MTSENVGQPQDGQGLDPETLDDLAERLSQTARAMEHEEGSEDTLAHVVRAAIELVPGTSEGSISLVVGRREVQSRASSGDLPTEVDRIQSATGQGPCLDAVFGQRMVSVPDVASDTRWPEFARQAAQAGAMSMLSFQLFVEGDNLGALNLYGAAPRAFDADSEHIGLLFAAHAAIAFSGARRQETLEAGLATRDLIGQAKGILMERYSIDADSAFAVLVRVSRTTNRKLRDVAQELVGTRQLSLHAAAPPATPAGAATT